MLWNHIIENRHTTCMQEAANLQLYDQELYQNRLSQSGQ